MATTERPISERKRAKRTLNKLRNFQSSTLRPFLNYFATIVESADLEICAEEWSEVRSNVKLMAASIDSLVMALEPDNGPEESAEGEA
jgi:hypothetical protein